MSLAQLKYENLIETQNILILPDVSGNSNKIFFNNQDVSGFPGLATDSFIMECLSPNDPQYPDSLLISYQAGSPSPNVPVMAMSGISGQGSGPAVEVLGDLLITGSLLPNGPVNFPDLSAGVCLIDNSQNLISQPSLNGKLNNEWINDSNATFFPAQEGTDNSWAIIDVVNREVRIYVNINYKSGAYNAIQVFVVATDPNWQTTPGTLPPPNSNFTDNVPPNATFFLSNLNFVNLSAGPVSFVGGNWYISEFNNNNFQISSTVNVNVNDDTMLLTGMISYPF